MHVTAEPAILYFGTPVVLISTVNEDGSYNLAPMSSAFWLGWRCVLGLASESKTPQNLLRTRQCVLNLPSPSQVEAVNRLALTTGTQEVPKGKQKRGYRYEKAKFETAGLAATPSETVDAPRVLECPVQLEAALEAHHGLAESDPLLRGRVTTFEVRVQRVHVDQSLLMNGERDKIDPDKWQPLIMSFQKFYGLTDGQVHASKLGTVPERLYRSPDVDRAREIAAA
jgi:flavin reductase (DIM6/NTAB) family NADH-FMN oxidoreductase RutF